MPELREDLIQNAVAFLRDPQVHSAPLNKKIEFLESKSLTQGEIDQALKRSQNDSKDTTSSATTDVGTNNHSQETTDKTVTGPSTGPTQYGQQYSSQQYYTPPPPALPERDWKDYFIMATTTVGVGYALYQITKRYLIPNILPDSKSKLEKDKEAINEEFLRIEATLNQISQTNKELKENELQKSQDISKTIEQVELVITQTKEKNEKIEGDVKVLKIEVENLRNSLDKAIEKQQNSLSFELTTIDNELKSLEQLIKSKNSLASELNATKGSTSPIPPTSSIPSASEILRKAKLNATEPSSSSSSASSVPPWQQNISTDGVTKSSIPSWQKRSNPSSDVSSSPPPPEPTASGNTTSIPAWQQVKTNQTTADNLHPYDFADDDEGVEPDYGDSEFQEAREQN